MLRCLTNWDGSGRKDRGLPQLDSPHGSYSVSSGCSGRSRKSADQKISCPIPAWCTRGESRRDTGVQNVGEMAALIACIFGSCSTLWRRFGCFMLWRCVWVSVMAFFCERDTVLVSVTLCLGECDTVGWVWRCLGVCDSVCVSMTPCLGECNDMLVWV